MISDAYTRNQFPIWSMERLRDGCTIFAGLSKTVQSLILTNLHVHPAAGRLHIINKHWKRRLAKTERIGCMAREFANSIASKEEYGCAVLATTRLLMTKGPTWLGVI